MKKRTLKRNLPKHATGATVGAMTAVGTAVAGPLGGAAVGLLNMGDEYTTDEYGAPKSGLKGYVNRVNPLSNINRLMEGKDIGRSLLGLSGMGALSEATGLSEKLFGESDYDKEARERKAREDNMNLAKRMNTNVNWGTSNINTSQEMQFAQGGMVLNYDDPNANAELELQETFQMPDGQVGNVDGPSHENGGIAVDLPEGTRIWSDKLKHNGRTFAKHTKPIINKIAKLEKRIESNPANSQAEQNSVMLLNQQLDYFFDTQEANKEVNEMKRTLRNGGMIKRADGSYSKRGLWDNIRANRGSGKKPTAEMLEQERKIKAEMEMGGMLDEYGKGGYTVRRTTERKGKTHVVTGPDGTKKYFGDPNMGERGKSKYGKEAFYARHKKNLANNPYFRAYAKATWEDGGLMEYDGGGPVLGMINPKTGQPYTMQDVSKYTEFENMLPTPFGMQYGGLDNKGNLRYGNYEQTKLLPVESNKVNYAQSTLTPTPLKNRVSFTPPMDSDFDINAIDPSLMYNTPEVVESSYGTKPFNQLPIGINRPNTNLNLGQFGANANSYTSPENLIMSDIGEATPGKTGQGFFNKAGQFIQNNPGLVGQLGTAALSAGIQSGRVNKLARPRTLGQVRLSDKVVNPNLVDYSAERQAYNRMGLNAMGEAQRGFGSSAAAQAFKNKARLNVLEGTGKSWQSQENTNAQIRNQANMARQEAAMKEAMINNEIDKYNLENVYGYDENKMRDLNAITGQMGNVASQTFGNITANKNQLKQLEMLSRGNYKGVNKKLLNDLGIDSETYEQLTGQKAPTKAYGGTIKRSFRDGGIHIKPENKGKFTSWAKSHGMGVQEAARHVMANKEDYSSTIVKRANFAKNAAGWKHEDGGYIEYAEGGNVNPYKQTLNKVTNFQTSKAAEQMDAEYAAALAAGKDKYTSSITGLDYKVLPKAEKRALVVDMWRDAHGEAPTQKQIESGVKAIEGKKVTSPKAKTMAEIVASRWKTGTTPAPEMTSEEEKYFLGVKDWGQFAKEQGAQALDAVSSLGFTAIGNPLYQMTGTDLGFGHTDLSPEAVNAKISNPNEYADAASNAMMGIMTGKLLNVGANKIVPKFYKEVPKYFQNAERDQALKNAGKVYKANQSNRNKRSISNYYKNNEPDIPRYVRNIANQEDEQFALDFNKRQFNNLVKRMESKLNVAEGADRFRKR